MRHSDALSPEQSRLLEILERPDSIGMSVVQVCELAGCHRSTYYRAMRTKRFVERLGDRGRPIMEAHKPEVDMVLMRAALAGKPWAVRLFYEVLGVVGAAAGLEVQDGDVEFVVTVGEGSSAIKMRKRILSSDEIERDHSPDDGPPVQ